MTTGATGQLGLALPVQGELSGTWGDTVNNGLTQYINIAIAGTLTLTGDGAVTLANTTGDASASNVTSTLTGAGTVTAQFAIVRVTGTLTVAKVVTGPSYSKTYTVVNAATGGIVTFKASGQTGVSIAVGETAFVYFNGTDYVKVVGTATAGAAGGSNTQVQFNSSGILAGSANLTFNGTTLTAAGFSGPLNGTVGATTPAAGTFTQIDITAQGPLRLQDTTGGEYVGLRSPSALGASYTLTFPADDGTSGQALITDGSGGLSWSTAASGDVYGPASATANGIALFDGTTGKIIKDSAAQDGLIYGLTVGRGAGAVSTNTAVGASALAATATGIRNTGVGAFSLNAVTSGAENTGIGYYSLYTNSTGSYNTALGDQSLQGNTSASNNTAVGYGSIFTNSTGANNTAVGVQSLAANTTASNNTAVGYQAGYSNTTGPDNTSFGGQAGYSNTTGGSNTAIGRAALYTSTGANNTAVGHYALVSNTTASYNTAVGYQAGYANTTGSITAVGYSVLTSNTTGSYNVGVGGEHTGTSGPTLGANTTGSYNTALGISALRNNTTANYNTAVGYQALKANTTALNNTAIGASALQANTTGNYNTASGHGALYFNTTGVQNTANGLGALEGNTTGGNNTAMGFQALLNNTTASNNTAVGYQAGYAITTESNNVYLGYSCGSSQTGSGGIFIGANAFSGYNGNNQVAFKTGDGREALYADIGAGASFRQYSNSSSWATVSDQRIKENVIEIENGLEKIVALRPVEFDYITNKEHSVGFIAQEFKNVLPDQVKKIKARPEEAELIGETEIYNIQQNLVPYLVKAIQELKAEFDAYKATHP
jgi:hypothetical protein